MKIILFILSLIFTFHTQAETVRIDFVPGCHEEFDVFFKKGFESLGYKAFVNYHGRSSSMPYDMLFTYEWNDHLLKISLSDKSGELINNEEKNFPYLDGIENMIYLMLSDLMDRRVFMKEYRGKIKGIFFNDMEKIDSAAFIIQVHNIDSANAISKFLTIAKELTGNFSTYYDFSYYQEERTVGTVILPFNASKLFGIVIGKPLNSKGSEILTEPPEIFEDYLENVVKNNPLPGNFPDNDLLSTIYILRCTGFVGSYMTYSLFVDEKFVCHMKNEEYLVLNLEPGWHTFTMQSSSKEVKPWSSTYKLEVLSGQKAFVKLIQDTDFTLQIIYQLEKEYSARVLLQNMVESNCLLD